MDVICVVPFNSIQFKQHLIYVYLMIIVVDFCKNFVYWMEWDGIEFVCTIEVHAIQSKIDRFFVSFYFFVKKIKYISLLVKYSIYWLYACGVLLLLIYIECVFW